jgi:membrane protein YdbS with pleckstrin-like domain
VKSKFPADLFVIVFGPVIVLLIAVALGSLIFHAEQLRGSAAAYALLAGGIVVPVVVLSCRFRHRQSSHTNLQRLRSTSVM